MFVILTIGVNKVGSNVVLNKKNASALSRYTLVRRDPKRVKRTLAQIGSVLLTGASNPSNFFDSCPCHCFDLLLTGEKKVSQSDRW